MQEKASYEKESVHVTHKKPHATMIPEDREKRNELLAELLQSRKLTEEELIQRQKDYEWEMHKHQELERRILLGKEKQAKEALAKREKELAQEREQQAIAMKDQKVDEIVDLTEKEQEGTTMDKHNIIGKLDVLFDVKNYTSTYPLHNVQYKTFILPPSINMKNPRYNVCQYEHKRVRKIQVENTGPMCNGFQVPFINGLQ
jgi:hypothetical protein